MKGSTQFAKGSAPASLDPLLDGISDVARAALNPIIRPGEKILWVGRPVPKAAWGDMMPSSIQNPWARALLYAISAAVAVYVLGWLLIILLGYTIDRLTGNFSYWDIVTLPILLFLVLFGLTMGMIIAGPWVSILRARHRLYLLTDYQAITIHEDKDGATIERKDLADVESPRVTRKRKNGLGDVIFGGISITQMSGDAGMDLHAFFDSGFTACPDAQHVASLMAKAREHRRQTKASEDMKEMMEDYQSWLRRNGKL